MKLSKAIYSGVLVLLHHVILIRTLNFGLNPIMEAAKLSANVKRLDQCFCEVRPRVRAIVLLALCVSIAERACRYLLL